MSRRVVISVLACAAAALGVSAAVLATASAEVCVVSGGSITPRIVAAAVVEPRDGVAKVRPRVEGRVLRVHVREGEAVKAGALLAEIEADLQEFEVRRREAESSALGETARVTRAGGRAEERAMAMAEERAAAAELASAEDAHGREESLAATGAVTDAALARARLAEQHARARLDGATARRRLLSAGGRPGEVRAAQQRFAAAQAAAESARREAEWTRLVAPIDGVVLAARMHVGDTVVAGNVGAPPVFEVADPSALELRADVDENDADALAVGLQARVYRVGSRQLEARGRVTRVSPRVDRRLLAEADGRERTGAVRSAWIEVTLPAGAALGARYEVELDLVPVRAATTVPRAALSVRDGRATIDVQWGLLWRSVPVELGASDERAVEIRGVREGTRVRLM